MQLLLSQLGLLYFVAAAQHVLRAVRKKSCNPTVAVLACQKSRCICNCQYVLMSSVVPRPIRERNYVALQQLYKPEKDLSAVAVETGKVANIVSSLRMFGKQSALQTSSDDSDRVTWLNYCLLKHRRPIAKIQIQYPRTSSIVPSR
jgi:hypothetical protein